MPACGDKSGKRKDEDGERVHADHAGHRHALHQERHRHRGIADGVPGKAGEEEVAQPFGKAEAEGKRRYATDIAAPEKPRHNRRKAVEKGVREGDADHGEGQSPGEVVGLDQKSLADPPEASEEIAETEPPADGESRPKAPQPAVGGFTR